MEESERKSAVACRCFQSADSNPRRTSVGATDCGSRVPAMYAAHACDAAFRTTTFESLIFASSPGSSSERTSTSTSSSASETRSPIRSRHFWLTDQLLSESRARSASTSSGAPTPTSRQSASCSSSVIWSSASDRKFVVGAANCARDAAHASLDAAAAGAGAMVKPDMRAWHSCPPATPPTNSELAPLNSRDCVSRACTSR